MNNEGNLSTWYDSTTARGVLTQQKVATNPEPCLFDVFAILRDSERVWTALAQVLSQHESGSHPLTGTCELCLGC